MKRKAFIKRIDCARDYMNRLWTALITTIAGTIAVLVSPDTGYKWYLFYLGIFFIVHFVNSCRAKSNLLKKLLKDQEKEEEK